MTSEYKTEQPERAEIDALAGPAVVEFGTNWCGCLLYTSPSPRDGLLSRMPSSA